MGRILGVMAAALCAAFVLSMTVFYIKDGSFEGAGARMDRVFANMSREAEKTASQAADATGDVIEDIADGPDQG
jgi:hypothetical protein